MWTGITNIVKSAASFLSSNRVPPGTSIERYKELKNENHFKSKKFFLAFSSFVGLLFFYLLSVGILFLLPSKNELIAGYVTIFTKTVEIIAIIVAAYIGVQAAVDLKYGSSSSVNIDSTLTPTEREDAVIEEQTLIYANKFKGDATYAPLEWIFSEERMG